MGKKLEWHDLGDDMEGAETTTGVLIRYTVHQYSGWSGEYPVAGALEHVAGVALEQSRCYHGPNLWYLVARG